LFSLLLTDERKHDLHNYNTNKTESILG